jgi:hypothetical protein
MSVKSAIEWTGVISMVRAIPERFRSIPPGKATNCSSYANDAGGLLAKRSNQRAILPICAPARLHPSGR